MTSSRFPDIVLDCPDPATLGRFYAEVVDGKLSLSDDWAELESGQGRSICFQQVADYNPPQWPGQEVPQQFHLDFYVKDLDAAEASVLQLGATKHENQPGTSFRVYLDPAGHPFCLCLE